MFYLHAVGLLHMNTTLKAATEAIRCMGTQIFWGGGGGGGDMPPDLSAKHAHLLRELAPPPPFPKLILDKTLTLSQR